MEAALSIIQLHHQQQMNFGARHWTICHVNHLLTAAWTFVSDLSIPASLSSFVQCISMIQAMEIKFSRSISNAFAFMFPFLKRWNKWTPQVWHACMSVVPQQQAEPGALARALSQCSPGSLTLTDQFDAAMIESSFGDWFGGGGGGGAGFAGAAGYVPHLYLDELDFGDIDSM